ncbi:MAG: hypothetical protein AAGF25_11130 [Pseudomonadota bacterium]
MNQASLTILGWPPHSSETVATGGDLSAAWDSIKQTMTDIGNGGHDYDPVPSMQNGHNSDATVDTAWTGLPQPAQDGPGDNWSAR